MNFPLVCEVAKFEEYKAVIVTRTMTVAHL